MPEGFVCGGDYGPGKKKGHRICSIGPSGLSERGERVVLTHRGEAPPSVNRDPLQPNALGDAGSSRAHDRLSGAAP
jgi:hypothetical protein